MERYHGSRSGAVSPVSRALRAVACASVCAVLLAAPANAVEWKKWVQKGKETAAEAIEWVGYRSGLGEQCLFVEKPAVAVHEYLKKNLVAQDRAIESVVAAVESWEFSRQSSKDRTPMVLAITGPTGTGKTEMSNLLAESLFKRTRKLPNSEKMLPTGLIIFRGEDFSDSFSNPITEYHTQIKTRLVEHLQFCSGKAVVVFDEVQKVIPHTLDAIMEAVSDRAQLSYYKNGVTKTIDTSNVIFMLVSDIGVNEMEHVIINYDNREDVPPAELENAVKGALDAQWARLRFGKMVDQVIPFLPFEHTHVAQIIDLKLRQLDVNYRGLYWHRLWIESGLAERMSLSDSMKYVVRKASVSGTVTAQKIYAVYGARSVETGPIQLLKSKLLRYLRPFNPESEVRVSFDSDANEVVIQSCGPEDPTKKLTDRTTDDEMISVTCAIKWQGALD